MSISFGMTRLIVRWAGLVAGFSLIYWVEGIAGSLLVQTAVIPVVLLCAVFGWIADLSALGRARTMVRPKKSLGELCLSRPRDFKLKRKLALSLLWHLFLIGFVLKGVSVSPGLSLQFWSLWGLSVGLSALRHALFNTGQEREYAVIPVALWQEAQQLKQEVGVSRGDRARQVVKLIETSRNDLSVSQLARSLLVDYLVDSASVKVEWEGDARATE